MADAVLTRDGPVSVPMDYTVPQSGELLPLTVRATLDGTSAAVPFYGAVQVIAPSGRIMFSAITTTSVAAGASADASWFPHVGGTTVTQGAGIPPFAALDDYVFKHANTTVTASGFGDQSNLIIQGNAISLDGNTRIKIEFFAPVVEITNGAPNQAIGFALWDGATNKGVIGYIEAGNAQRVTLGSNQSFGGPVYGVIIDTPAAGTHTYAVYAFNNAGLAGGTNTVFASTFQDGTGNIGPAWYRVTTT